jgi:hypothetical protein
MDGSRAYRWRSGSRQPAAGRLPQPGQAVAAVWRSGAVLRAGRRLRDRRGGRGPEPGPHIAVRDNRHPHADRRGRLGSSALPELLRWTGSGRRPRRAVDQDPGRPAARPSGSRGRASSRSIGADGRWRGISASRPAIRRPGPTSAPTPHSTRACSGWCSAATSVRRSSSATSPAGDHDGHRCAVGWPLSGPISPLWTSAPGRDPESSSARPAVQSPSVGRCRAVPASVSRPGSRPDWSLYRA